MISEALSALGYNEFVVRGNTYDGIEWMIIPETIPSKETVLAKVEELKELEAEVEAQKIAKKEAYQSALTKLSALGLTEEEVQAIIK
jgi:hypothetical protein